MKVLSKKNIIITCILVLVIVGVVYICVPQEDKAAVEEPETLIEKVLPTIGPEDL